MEDTADNSGRMSDEFSAVQEEEEEQPQPWEIENTKFDHSEAAIWWQFSFYSMIITS